MPQELPIPEQAYRNWLASHSYDLQKYLGLVRAYLDTIGLDELPPQVVLPGAIPYNLLINKVSVPGASGSDFAAFTAMWQAAAFFASYRETRYTYHVMPSLWECLCNTPFPENAPTEALKYLPRQAFGLNLPGVGGTKILKNVGVWYDLLAASEKEGLLELRFIELLPRSVLPFAKIPITGSLEDAMDVIYGEDRLGATGVKAKQMMKSMMTGIVNVLLYMAGDDDVVRRVGHYRGGITKKQMRGLKETKAGPGILSEIRREPEEFDVGVRFEQAMIRYAEQEKNEQRESTGEKREIRPHIRRAHAHLYWTGPRASPKPNVKFLPPIPVKGGGDGRITPTVQPVR